ncbi:MAG: hypothetical protein K2N93_02640 [Alistipes sp.]|nr:hypothetical protein [Alistipes sp.]
MLGFTPFKKHANRFNYIPRYYDPEKEAREQRRAELRGERSEDAEREYRPGQYIRTQRDARAARRAARAETDRTRIFKMAAGAVLVLLFIYMLYPRLAEVFVRAQRSAAVPAAADAAPRADGPRDLSEISETEWQAQPITIVPNDYEEE